MKLIVGLGNPGIKYARTKHNAGFIALDELAQKLGAPAWRLEKKFETELAEINTGGEKILLAKPQTFMNLSGEAVRKLMTFYKLTSEELTVVHDDLDLELGTIKISVDSSAGGHNGVQSIIDNLGTQHFKRIRIGIEGSKAHQQRSVSGRVFVLSDLTEKEMTKIQKLAASIEI